MKNPIATITMENGAEIVVELMPELAPNTVNSFIYLAGRGAFDNYKIARVEPDFVVDVSTNAYDREVCRYLIENEAGKIGAEKRLPPELGVIGMGGYENGIAGGEFFFPLKHVPRLDGNYPMFGKIIKGVQEIIRIGSGPVEEFAFNPPGMVLHKPVNREVISTVKVETFGVSYPEPVRLDTELPAHWLMEDYSKKI
jgi:peptidyl-prolyl cis-trans isomerase B (cyclophilin B)